MVGVPVQAQKLENYDGVLTRVPSGRVWTVPKRFGEGGTLALTFLDVKRNQFAVVIEGPRKADEIPSRVLSFYIRKGGQFVETHRFTTPNFFVAMLPNIEGNRLFTTWGSGSAYRTGIFALEKDEVRVVLWLGWKQAPEFVDLDGDGEEEIIHTVPNVPSHRQAETAEIYKWTGREYQLLRTVPWPARYQNK